MKVIELFRDISVKRHHNSNGSSRELDEVEISDILSDSRRVTRGSLFVCLRGSKTDGHNYIADAIKKGAAAILAEEGADIDTSVFDSETSPLLLFTDNTRCALAFLFDAWYGHPTRGMKLVAVTGTNGKTSITFMLRGIFSAMMEKTGLIGTVFCYSDQRLLNIRSADENANMTTPDPGELYKMLAEMKKDGVSIVFLEATSHALALHKLDPLRFDAAIFTNLTPDHLDFHKTMENYLEAKKRLFGMCDIAIINGDDAYAPKIAEAASNGGCKRIRICTLDDRIRADYTAVSPQDHGCDGIEYLLSSVCSVFKIRSPMPGRFTVMNTLESAACALELGAGTGCIQDALRHMKGAKGRFERIKLCASAPFKLFIDYAHTPDALRNLLITVRNFRKPHERIVLLFGCGGDRDKSKRPIMGTIASSLADFVVITSDNSRSEEPSDIISDIKVGFDFTRAHAVVIESRAEAIDYVIENAMTDDIVILAGKGHEEYEIDKRGKHPFSERNIAAASAEKYYGKG